MQTTEKMICSVLNTMKCCSNRQVGRGFAKAISTCLDLYYAPTSQKVHHSFLDSLIVPLNVKVRYLFQKLSRKRSWPKTILWTMPEVYKIRFQRYRLWVSPKADNNDMPLQRDSIMETLQEAHCSGKSRGSLEVEFLSWSVSNILAPIMDIHWKLWKRQEPNSSANFDP